VAPVTTARLFLLSCGGSEDAVALEMEAFFFVE